MAEPRYKVEFEEVGSGGFGKVRRGKDTTLDRDVAVKTLDPLWMVADERDKERFRREARILAKLSHPNIPSIYDVVFTDSEFHIVFQFIEGKTLRDLLEDGPLSLAEVQSWFDQVASGLEHAHAKGVIHRDLKPENMIVTSDRKHCYLVDFGIALSEEDYERLTHSDERLGTPGYMSPAQENGELLDSSDDVYVLGVCLYEALCGHQIPRGDYDPLNIQDESIPPTIDELVQRCIAPKAQRIRSAKEFRHALRAALLSHRPLSTVLFQGQLHEVIGAIREMTPQEFLQLPAGQRLVILSKCRDLVADHNPRLVAARSEFLSVLSTLAVQVDTAHYKAIVKPALNLGFDAQLDSRWSGDRRIRDALKAAAITVSKPNHHGMVETVLAWLSQGNLEAKQNWYFHEARQLVTRLMVNPACHDHDAEDLNQVLLKINDLQREQSAEEEGEYADSEFGSVDS